MNNERLYKIISKEESFKDLTTQKFKLNDSFIFLSRSKCFLSKDEQENDIESNEQNIYEVEEPKNLSGSNNSPINYNYTNSMLKFFNFCGKKEENNIPMEKSNELNEKDLSNIDYLENSYFIPDLSSLLNRQNEPLEQNNTPLKKLNESKEKEDLHFISDLSSSLNRQNEPREQNNISLKKSNESKEKDLSIIEHIEDSNYISDCSSILNRINEPREQNPSINENEEKIDFRKDRYIKFFKTFVSKFIKRHTNDLIVKSGIKNKIGGKLLTIDSLSFTGNPKINDNKKFMKFLLKDIFWYPEHVSKKNQKKNKVRIEKIFQYEGNKKNKYLDELKNFLSLSYQEVIEYFYKIKPKEFEKFSSSSKAKFFDKKLLEETKEISLLEKDGFIKLIQTTYGYNKKGSLQKL